MIGKQDHRSVSQALYQLDFYLKTVELPFGVKDLYRAAYRDLRGQHYSDEWLDHLGSDPRVKESLDQPFTTHTIAETLLLTGHHPILREMMRRLREEGIGFMQAYIAGTERRSQ